MTRISVILYFLLATSCGSQSTQPPPDYKKYTFDQHVIDKLPVYDSLIKTILENFTSFQKLISEKDSYRAYRYRPLSNESDVSKNLPQEGAAKINQYFEELGKNFIYGFDIFKDSTVKIYIRSSYSGTLQLDIRENLSYYPPRINIKRRELPIKDTILNKSWQYWISFDERPLF
ncbi:MAG: hypothetical protein V4685_05435 [Bacteroidota bacterium]